MGCRCFRHMHEMWSIHGAYISRIWMLLEWTLQYIMAKRYILIQLPTAWSNTDPKGTWRWNIVRECTSKQLQWCTYGNPSLIIWSSVEQPGRMLAKFKLITNSNTFLIYYSNWKEYAYLIFDCTETVLGQYCQFNTGSITEKGEYRLISTGKTLEKQCCPNNGNTLLGYY